MTITISSEDPRSIKAIEIAAGANSWIRCTTRDGRNLVGIPSLCKPGAFYLVDPVRQTCDCQDFQRHGLSSPRVGADGFHGQCKHLRGLLLHLELVKAQQARPASRRRGHLSVVPTAARYDDIFKRFEGE
jgi:hypothetical protein